MHHSRVDALSANHIADVFSSSILDPAPYSRPEPTRWLELLDVIPIHGALKLACRQSPGTEPCPALCLGRQDLCEFIRVHLFHRLLGRGHRWIVLMLVVALYTVSPPDVR
jgi:hypothetical protein